MHDSIQCHKIERFSKYFSCLLNILQIRKKLMREEGLSREKLTSAALKTNIRKKARHLNITIQSTAMHSVVSAESGIGKSPDTRTNDLKINATPHQHHHYTNPPDPPPPNEYRIKCLPKERQKGQNTTKRQGSMTHMDHATI